MLKKEKSLNVNSSYTPLGQMLPNFLEPPWAEEIKN